MFLIEIFKNNRCLNSPQNCLATAIRHYIPDPYDIENLRQNGTLNDIFHIPKCPKLRHPIAHLTITIWLLIEN